jgi:hypothetical protein
MALHRLIKINPVYMGETSSLSFLYFLKRTIKGYIGSVPFTEEGGQQVNMETQDSAVEGMAQPLSFDERCSLLDSYFEAVSTTTPQASSIRTALIPHRQAVF